jgi:signal transduction histidine kinase
MRHTRRQPTGRGRLSLRSRLLAGLITITALFLIVMGVVTTVVLGNIEQDQFNTDLGLTVKESVSEIANLENGYAAAYINVGSRSAKALSGPSDTAKDLQNLLNNLLVSRQATAYFLQNRAQTLFTISGSGEPDLTAIWRRIYVGLASKNSLLPAGENILLVARPDNAVGDQVRGLILAEVITGAILLALLALGGRWLISRGLAPLDRMASTADVITSRGDLTARMPDPGDHAEAGRLAAAINTMLDRIQQAFGARWASEQKVRQFAADASHELRTPLTTIRGYAELYRQGALGPDRLPNAMRRIEQEADRMSSLVAELLELARLDRNSSLDLTETDMAELVRDAVADAKAVEPSRPVSATAPSRLIVIADEPRIRQVLANLLGNVREHTAPQTPVAVRLAQAGQGALLEVTDAGQGMSEDAAARAFDRFYRGGHNGNGHGSGLGLSIVQAIAAAHGGHAMLKSAVGGGTSVQFWIPFRPAGQSDDGAEDPAGARDPAQHHLSRNCLLSFSLLSGYIFPARRHG